jgi:CubicO group peptidase (beta-lactamase class C family)
MVTFPPATPAPLPFSYEVVSPADVGIDPARLALFMERARMEVESGALPSVQVAVARHGRLVLDQTFGAAEPTDRYILQSVGRTVVAGVAWKLLGEGIIGIDERVGDVIPEFATNGKEVVTVEQVLTHTAGFPFAPLGYPKMLDRRLRLEAMSRWRLTSEPGTLLQFHLTAAAWVIAELVERRTGQSFAGYLRTALVDPLGLGFLLPVPAADYHTVLAVPTVWGGEPGDEVDPWGPWYLANPDVLAAGEPSHSIAGRAADVALWYQALLHSDRWPAGAVEDGRRIRRSEPPAGERLYGGSPETLNVALFVTVAGEVGGTWTPRTGSPETFGNGGAPCQLGFCDPETGVSFSFLTNGYPPSGYDYSRRGTNRIINLANLGNDLAG